MMITVSSYHRNVSKSFHKKIFGIKPSPAIMVFIRRNVARMNFDDLLLEPEKNRKRRSQPNVKYLKTKKTNYLCALSNERVDGIQKQSIFQLKLVNGLQCLLKHRLKNDFFSSFVDSPIFRTLKKSQSKTLLLLFRANEIRFRKKY